MNKALQHVEHNLLENSNHNVCEHSAGFGEGLFNDIEINQSHAV